jgi:hypothetical protein
MKTLTAATPGMGRHPMKTLTAATPGIRARAPLLVLLGVVSALPACSLERRPILPEYRTYTASAVVTNGAGDAVSTFSGDPVLTGGMALALTDRWGSDPDGPERAREHWLRYLRRRLEIDAVGPEFRARFGGGPFCVRDVALTPAERAGAPAPEETADPLPDCDAPGFPPACRADGSTPTLELSPPSEVDLGSARVGTPSAPSLVTIANAGDGRLCLSAPALDPALSPNPEDFGVDATDCLPLSDEERAAGFTFLDATRPSCSVRVTATPGEDGLRQASLRVSSSDAARPVVRLGLSVRGVAGALVAPSSVCFAVPIAEYPGLGPCRRRQVSIRNDSPAEVTVRSVSLPAEAERRWLLREFVPGRPGDPGFESGVRLAASGGTLTLNAYVCAPDPADSTTLTIATNAIPAVLDIPFLNPDSGCTP